MFLESFGFERFSQRLKGKIRLYEIQFDWFLVHGVETLMTVDHLYSSGKLPPITDVVMV